MKQFQIIATALVILAGLASPLLAAPETDAPTAVKNVDEGPRPGKAPWIRKSAARSAESDAILELFRIGGTGVIVIVTVLILGLIFGVRRAKMTAVQRQRLAAMQANTLKSGGRASEPIATLRR